MRKVVQYNGEKERQDILATNSHLYWIEERNTVEGNFLVFSDVPLSEAEPRVVYTNVPKEGFESIKRSIAELTTILGGRV